MTAANQETPAAARPTDAARASPDPLSSKRDAHQLVLKLVLPPVSDPFFFWDSHLRRGTLACLFWAELWPAVKKLHGGHFERLSVLPREVVSASVGRWAVRMYLAAATKRPETRGRSFFYLCRYLGDTVHTGCLIWAVFQPQCALSASCSVCSGRLDVSSVGSRPAVFSLMHPLAPRVPQNGSAALPVEAQESRRPVC